MFSETGKPEDGITAGIYGIALRPCQMGSRKRYFHSSPKIRKSRFTIPLSATTIVTPQVLQIEGIQEADQQKPIKNNQLKFFNISIRYSSKNPHDVL
ncbi:hypothetical protein V9T40_006938 [Parthenolecanium corni]|uniref:Uncharacterized protein n=1 Tax=Parthenolecanium corni TaxID=536013 RepID=A0AAN9TXX5_9HEMI